MSLFKRLLIVMAGFAAAFYALNIGPTITSVRWVDLNADLAQVSPVIVIGFTAAMALTGLTFLVTILVFLRNVQDMRVSYERLSWTLGLLTIDSAFFGMLMTPDLHKPLVWLVGASPAVQAIFTVMVVPIVLTLIELVVSVFVASDEHDARVLGAEDPVLAAIAELKELAEGQGKDIDHVLVQTGWVETEKEWVRPTTTLAQKVRALLEASGGTIDEKTGEWTFPPPADDPAAELIKVHGRLDGVFPMLKDVLKEVQAMNAKAGDPEHNPMESLKRIHELLGTISQGLAPAGAKPHAVPDAVPGVKAA